MSLTVPLTVPACHRILPIDIDSVKVVLLQDDQNVADKVAPLLGGRSRHRKVLRIRPAANGKECLEPETRLRFDGHQLPETGFGYDAGSAQPDSTG